MAGPGARAAERKGPSTKRPAVLLRSFSVWSDRILPSPLKPPERCSPTFTGLLVTFIGEPLTAGLLRKAWPDAFSDASTEET